MEENCIFCKIIAGEVSAEKVGESENFIAIRDAHPDTEGHSLIMPKQHWVDLLEIPDKYGKELLSFIKKIGSKLMDEGFGDGFNQIANTKKSAGQLVMHAHIHLIPRKVGDGLRFGTYKA